MCSEHAGEYIDNRRRLMRPHSRVILGPDKYHSRMSRCIFLEPIAGAAGVCFLAPCFGSPKFESQDHSLITETHNLASCGATVLGGRDTSDQIDGYSFNLELKRATAVVNQPEDGSG